MPSPTHLIVPTTQLRYPTRPDRKLTVPCRGCTPCNAYQFEQHNALNPVHLGTKQSAPSHLLTPLTWMSLISSGDGGGGATLSSCFGILRERLLRGFDAEAWKARLMSSVVKESVERLRGMFDWGIVEVILVGLCRYRQNRVYADMCFVIVGDDRASSGCSGLFLVGRHVRRWRRRKAFTITWE